MVTKFPLILIALILKSISAVRRMLKYSHFPQMKRMRSNQSLWIIPPFDILDPGYSICWDNVQKLSISRHHLRQENKMMLWALCFAAKNRISFRHLDRLDDKCSSTGDWQLLRSRMEHVVKKILCKYFPQFSDMEVKDITHQYSEISNCVPW